MFISVLLQALTLSTDSNLTSILHKNTAASFLKLNKFEEALRHCDKGLHLHPCFIGHCLTTTDVSILLSVLEISPQDPKALYRRATALEGLERYEEAYRDAQKALVSSPADAKTFTPLLSRLHILVEQRRTRFSQVKDKATRMIRLAFEASSNDEEQETGLNNVLVLCRERAGLEALLELGLLVKLKTLLQLKSPTVQDMKRKVTAIRTLSEAIRFNIEMVSIKQIAISHARISKYL